MKKLHSISLLLLSALAFTACVNEEDDLFSESAAARLNAAESRYTDILTASPGGWTMEYYPTNDTVGFKGKGYLMLADFERNGTVRVGMWNAFSGNFYQEDTSLWDIITDNGPVLSFNTYNECLHAFCDPHDLPASIQGVSADDKEDVTGLGAEGDYEFVLTDVKADEDVITVKGKKRGSYVRMVKLPEDVDFESYLLGIEILKAAIFPSSAPNDTYLTLGDREFTMTGVNTGYISLYPSDGDPITDTKDYAFIFNYDDGQLHLRFRNPVVNGESQVQNLVWNKELDSFVDADGGDAVLTGPKASSFFYSKLEGNKTWRLSKTSPMSEKAQAIYDAVATNFRSINATMNYVNVRINGGQPQISLSYRTKQNATANYNYNLEIGDDIATFGYVAPNDNAAQAVLNTVSSLQVLLDMFGQKFTVVPYSTSFNLNTIKLVSVADPDLWMQLTLY